MKKIDIISLEFFAQKKSRHASRRLPYLPRVGFYMDVAGWELVFKKSPILEALLEVVEKNLHPSHVYRIAREHLAAIEFPRLKKVQVIDTSHRNL